MLNPRTELDPESTKEKGGRPLSIPARRVLWADARPGRIRKKDRTTTAIQAKRERRNLEVTAIILVWTFGFSDEV
jgi:hypothetical protein